MGYTDMPLLRAWEATLTGNRLRTWEDIRDALENADPEMRAAAVSWALECDLAEGRAAYSVAWKAEQRFKADLIKRNGKAMAEKIRWLNGSVQEALQAIEVWRAVGSWALRKTQHALEHAHVVSMVRVQFRRVHGPWTDCEPGAEWGKGITGYDTPEGVAEARQRHEARMAAVRAARAREAQTIQQEHQPLVAARREEEAQHAAARAAARKAEEDARASTAQRPAAPPGQGSLFGPR